MKKYWLPIVISVVMIISIGTFYIQSALATKNMPQYFIDTIHGDEKEIDTLSVTGFYYDDLSYIGEVFEIGAEGTKYWKEKSFFERIDGMYDSLFYNPQIKNLQEEYRNFMRGKSNHIDSFFENENILAYVEVSNKNPYVVSGEFEFDVAVLDKKSNKTVSFHQPVPNSGDFWYLNVKNVQMVDGKLKVFVQNDVREDDRVETHLYTFDLEKEALVNDEVILTSEEVEDKWITISTVDVDDPTKESKYIAYVKTTTNVDDEGSFGDIAEEELILYDLTSNAIKVINLENQSEYGYPVHLDGSTIYFNEVGDDGIIRNAVYDIDSEQVVDEFEVELANYTNEWRWVRKFNEGKLYFVNSTDSSPGYVTVINFKNGEKIFEGEIKLKDQKNSVDLVRLNIQDIKFK